METECLEGDWENIGCLNDDHVMLRVIQCHMISHPTIRLRVGYLVQRNHTILNNSILLAKDTFRSGHLPSGFAIIAPFDIIGLASRLMLSATIDCSRAAL